MERAMEWPKDRKKAFLWAAEAFGTPWAKRTKGQKDLTRDGICWTISKLVGSNMIYWWASDFGVSVGIVTCHWWPIRREGGWRAIHDKQRSLFCYLMAALSDKEFDELQA